MNIRAESLGNGGFRRDYRLRYAYLAGSMYKGIASKELVVAMAKGGMMGFLGAGGLDLSEIDAAIRFMRESLPEGQPYGVNLLCNLERPDLEERTVDLLLSHQVPFIEAAAFFTMTPSLVRCRLTGLKRSAAGTLQRPRRIIAKVSRPEVATAFMQPAPEPMVRDLLAAGAISQEEAVLSQSIPVADDICVEADSGGHTDQRVAYTLMPVMLGLRDEMVARYRYGDPIRVGAAGGIGTPQAAAAAFIMGADFVLTGSINQCTVEAATSESVKDILQDLNVQDTAYAPAGDMFELGAKVQVAKKGLFFPTRANKLYELYTRYNSIEEIDDKTSRQIQDKYFRRSFEEVWRETRAYWLKTFPDKIAEIERNPKRRMSLIFRWYFVHSTRLAMRGIEEQKVDYQIQCGPAMGAFNQWVKGTELQSWRQRHVAPVGHSIMTGAAALLNQRFDSMRSASAAI